MTSSIRAEGRPYPQQLRSHLEDLLEWKNLTLTKVYNAEAYTIERLMDWVAWLPSS